MGGKSGGRKAADQVIMTAKQIFERHAPAKDDPGEMLKQIVMESHLMIKLTAITSEEEPHSTIAAYMIGPDRECDYVHAGDSRVYHFRGPDMVNRTSDHSYVQRLISEGKPIPVFGDGTTRRDYTYVDDIIAGILAALSYRETPFEVINLGESQTVELRYLIALLEKALGKTAIIDRQPEQPGDVPVTYADISKARRLLGYAPQTKIEDGIERFVEWFKSTSSIRE